MNTAIKILGGLVVLISVLCHDYQQAVLGQLIVITGLLYDISDKLSTGREA